MSKITLALILSLILSLTLSNAYAQTAQDRNVVVAEQTSDSEAALRLDLSGLEAEAEEIEKPLARARAMVEVADVVWALDEPRAKKSLRAALELTFPEEVDRPKLRQHSVGAPLTPPTPELQARGAVRARLLRVAARDRAFERELLATTARELGPLEETSYLAGQAGEAAREGRVEEAGELLRRAMEAEPTLISIGTAINEVAARDRAAADRLIIQYVERLRALPISTFAERNHAALRVAISFVWLLAPAGTGPQPTSGPVAPAGREAVRAYLRFLFETLNRLEHLQPGGSANARPMLALAAPLVAEHAPELAGQFSELEKLGRRTGQTAPDMPTFEEIEERGQRSYEERIKQARKTKDPFLLEVAVGFAKSKNDFAEARRLLDLLPEGDLKTKLTEAVVADEVVHLTERGDTTGAEKLARHLNAPDSVLRAFPPLIRRLVKNRDNSSAALLTGEAVRRLKRAEESKEADGTYVPSALAGLVKPPRGSRLPQAISELAAVVEPADDALAFELLEELVRSANKNDAFTQNGNPGFNTDVFKQLAARDESRARQTVEGFRDRLQKVVALAGVYRWRADALAERRKTDAKRMKADRLERN